MLWTVWVLTNQLVVARLESHLYPVHEFLYVIAQERERETEWERRETEDEVVCFRKNLITHFSSSWWTILMISWNEVGKNQRFCAQTKLSCQNYFLVLLRNSDGGQDGTYFFCVCASWVLASCATLLQNNSKTHVIHSHIQLQFNYLKTFPHNFC